MAREFFKPTRFKIYGTFLLTAVALGYAIVDGLSFGAPEKNLAYYANWVTAWPWQLVMESVVGSYSNWPFFLGIAAEYLYVYLILCYVAYRWSQRRQLIAK